MHAFVWRTGGKMCFRLLLLAHSPLLVAIHFGSISPLSMFLYRFI
jgi:hypothetical protein